MADATILSKWQALFPNNSPESNPNAVNGQGVDGDYNLVNAVKSPFRDRSSQSTDTWSSNNSFPLKGESDILSWNYFLILHKLFLPHEYFPDWIILNLFFDYFSNL